MQSRHLRASGMHFSCPGKGWGVGNGAILEPNRERENKKSLVPVNSLHPTGLLYICAFVFEQNAFGLINTPCN